MKSLKLLNHQKNTSDGLFFEKNLYLSLGIKVLYTRHNMARKIIISEEQYRKMMNEEVKNNLEVPVVQKGNETPGQAFERTRTEIENTGKGDKFKICYNPTKNENQTFSEGKLITKSDLQRNRLKVLKENSQVYTVREFMNGLTNKITF